MSRYKMYLHRAEQAVQLGVVVFLLSTAIIAVTHGIVASQEPEDVTATAASATAGASTPTTPAKPVSTPSQKDTLSPKCKAETEKNIADFTAKNKRAPNAEELKQLTARPAEVSDTKKAQKGSDHEYCVSQKKVEERYGEECGKCENGVDVVPGAVIQNQCSKKGLGFVVACRQNEEAKKPEPQGDASSSKTPEDLAKQVAGTDQGQGQGGAKDGGGQGGGGGSPSGGGGSSESPQNEAARQAFEDSPPLPERKNETLVIEKDGKLAEQIDQANQALDNFYDTGQSDAARERELLANRERLLAERASLAPYTRQALMDEQSSSVEGDWAQQQTQARLSELDEFVQTYQAQAYQPQEGGQDSLDFRGVPYADPYNANSGTLSQVDAPQVGASYYSCLASQGSTCYGGDGARTSQNRLRDGDIAITPQLRQQIGLAHNEIADVLLEGPYGQRAWATVRDEIGFGNQVVPNYAPGAGQRVQIDYFREPGRSTSSLMNTLGLTRSAGLQGNVRVVLLRRY